MSYSPQPGTIAFRAIAWLEKQPKGTEVTASMWAEEIGTDGNTLGVCLKPAVDGGWVKRFTKDGMTKPQWYALGDGKPPAKPPREPEPVSEPKPIAELAEAMVQQRSSGGRPMTLTECAQAEEKPAPPHPFDCWLSGVTGEMVLQGVTVDEDGDVVLPSASVTALRRVLLGVNA